MTELEKEKAVIEVFKQRWRRKKDGDSGKENIEQSDEPSTSNSGRHTTLCTFSSCGNVVVILLEIENAENYTGQGS